MAAEEVDVNTFLSLEIHLQTQVHGEHQLRSGQNYLINGKKYIEPCKT